MSILSLSDVPAPIREAISQASRKTGTDFEYLLKTAHRESRFDHDARARRSSAAGLFQFIESTWLQLVKEEGARFGLGNYAKAIQKTADGRYVVADPQMRQKILDLRFKPQVAASLAAVHTRRNESYMTAVLGKTPDDGELYVTHMLGIGDGARLIKLADKTPHARADNLFPKAARSNPGVFYEAGQARTVKEVYDFLVGQHRNLVAESEASGTTGLAGLFQALGELVSFSPAPSWLPEGFDDLRDAPGPAGRSDRNEIGSWRTEIQSSGDEGMPSGNETAGRDPVASSSTTTGAGFRWQTTLFDDKGNVIPTQLRPTSVSMSAETDQDADWIERVFNPLV